jgi:hydroxyethylthiazole kinase-like uncharacterized protein yjeF
MLPSLAYCVARVREAEEAFPGQLSDGTLMARAAWAASQVAIRMLHEDGHAVTGAHVVILTGSGNNGGDALWAGAHLAARGADVTAITTSTDVHVAGLAALLRAGGRRCAWPTEPDRALQWLSRADLVLDGLVGIGAKGPLRQPAADLVRAANGVGARVLAVDLPSGLDADTGAVPGVVLPADRTVTFGCAKPGLLLSPGCTVTGRLDIIDIGIAGALTGPACQWLAADDLVTLRAQLQLRPTDHKYRRGVVGVVAGSHRYPGAALLTVGAALRSGVGMVRFLDCDDGCAAEVVRRYPEVVIVNTPHQPGEQLRAWVCGPGLSQEAAPTVDAILRTDVPVVLDATALAIVADEVTLCEQLTRRQAPTVLTPHYGEARRLARAFALELVGEPLRDAQFLARATGCIVLLKGPGTVIAGSGIPWVNRTAGAELSCAGSGDVLSGLLGGLLAIRASVDEHTCAQTAALAAHLHGLAGQRARDALGQPRTVIATDLIRALACLDTSH